MIPSDGPGSPNLPRGYLGKARHAHAPLARQLGQGRHLQTAGASLVSLANGAHATTPAHSLHGANGTTRTGPPSATKHRVRVHRTGGTHHKLGCGGRYRAPDLPTQGKRYAYIQDSDCSRSFMPYLPRNLVRDRYMW